jgi:hypothetical protein
MDRDYGNEALKGTSKFYIMVISFIRQVLGNEENMKTS